jgi:hypothetical protein
MQIAMVSRTGPGPDARLSAITVDEVLAAVDQLGRPTDRDQYLGQRVTVGTSPG